MHTAEIWKDINTPFKLAPEQIEHFRREGFVKLKNVLSPATVDYYGRVITEKVFELNTLNKPLSQRTTYEKAFLQIMNLWTKSDVVKEFSFSRRLAQIAAELMGVTGVRMYHDQALYKEAGGGFTPWHADEYYWPLDTDNTVTVWVPLQATPLEMGPLQFSAGSHRYAMGRNLEISDDSEIKISKALLEKGLPLINEPFDLGEVSYHYGWTFHRAGPNTTGQARKVMTIIYFADGARLSEPKNKHQINDWNGWLPGAKVNELAATWLNPVLYSA